MALTPTIPARRLEVEFDAGIWTDVSADLLVSHNVSRGRTSEQGAASVGQAQFTLRNSDGRYDPLNPASRYAGKLLPLRRVRYSAVLADGTTVYRRFTGRVTGWPQQWTKQGRFGTVTLNCVDGLRDLSAYAFPKSYASQVTDDKPMLWWRLNDPAFGFSFQAEATVQSADSPPFDISLSSAQGDTTRTLSLVPGDGLGARRVTGAGPYLQGSLFAAADFTVEVLWKPEILGANGTFAYPYRSSGGTYVRAAYTGSTATAFYQASIDNPGVGTIAVPLSTAVRPVPGRTDHVLLCRAGTTVTVIVNGVALGSVSINSGSVGLGSGGGAVARFGDRDTAGQSLVIDEPAIYFTALPDARVAAHYSTITSPAQFDQQTVKQRANAILDAIGWPSGDRVLADTGRLVAPSGDLGGTTALAALQDAVNVDLGLVFADHLGRIVTLDRPAPGATSVGVLGDGNTPAEFPYTDDLTIDFDDQRIANDITVSAPGEPVLQARVTDPTSIGVYGPRTSSLSAPFATQADVNAAAAYLLARQKNPAARVDTVTLNVAANPALLPVLALGTLGQTVTVRRRPPAPAPPIEVRCVIEQIRETGGQDALTVALTLSPAP